jgi:hypothetical protein
MDILNTKLTHGLLVESFKQSLVDLISQNPLDIQSKALVLDCVNAQIQKLSDQQTQKEIAEYNEEQKRLEKESQKQDNEANKEK